MDVCEFRIKANKTQAEIITEFLHENGLRSGSDSTPLHDIETEYYIFYNKYNLSSGNINKEYYITDNIYLFNTSNYLEFTFHKFTQFYLRDKIIENILK